MNTVGPFLLAVGLAYLVGGIGLENVSFFFSIPGLVFVITGATTLIQQ